MAKNKPYWDNARKGAVKDRTQFFNEQTNLWTKRDTENWQFLDNKTSWGKFKWVRKEK